MNQLTSEELQAIRVRAEKASEGPWSVNVPVDYCANCKNGYEIVQSELFLAPIVAELNDADNAVFIAHAREDVPKLVAEVERLREAIIEAIADIEAISPHEAKKTLREALNNSENERESVCGVNLQKLFETQAELDKKIVKEAFESRYPDLLDESKKIKELEKENRKLKAFYEYWEELYGQGLEIANWHLNGNLESFDSFFEDALEKMRKLE